MQKTFPVEGMSCAACAVSLESYLKNTLPLESVSVNYPTQTVSIDFNPNSTSIFDLQKKAEEIGYKIIHSESQEATRNFLEEQGKRTLKTIKNKLIVAAVFTLPIFIISMFLMHQLPYEHLILFALSLPVMIYSGEHFYRSAWKKLLKKQTNMDTLVALSTGIALGYSIFIVWTEIYAGSTNHHVYFESATVIITLILLGKFLEEKAKQTTSASIRELFQLQPKTAKVIRNGELVILAVEDIVPFDIIHVLPGDIIPVDGKIKQGQAYINESSLTGEPLPISKTKGDTVYTSTINMDGTLKILAQKVGSETVLSSIINRVEIALGSKPPVQQLADKIAGIFTPIVLGIALASGIYWYLNEDTSLAITSMINVLIIACPCALGLATPTALVVGLGEAAKNGILFKDSSALENLHKTTDLVFDKTGTLTEGAPTVVDSYFSPYCTHSTLSALKFAETQSNHPLAIAIVNHLNACIANLPDFDSNNIKFKEITGQGIELIERAHRFFIGSYAWIDNMGFHPNDEEISFIDDQKNKGNTLVLFAKNSTENSNNQIEILAIFGISDRIKSDAKLAIANIQKLKIRQHLVTGDIFSAAQMVARELQIPNIKANTLPLDKLDYIQQLQANLNFVTMVGDGINDAPALAQANVGIAMGKGTQVALETANVTLKSNQLLPLSQAIAMSKITFSTINQNLFWAFFYNILAIPIAGGALIPNFGFVLNPMIAGAAMSLSSLTVLGNSLYLKIKIKQLFKQPFIL